jgi:hypothetical protein
VLPFFGFVLATLQEINSKGFSPTSNLPFERQTNIYYWSIPHMTRIWQRRSSRKNHANLHSR